MRGAIHQKDFTKEPSKIKTTSLLKQTRINLHVLVGLLTGYCRINKHFSRIELIQNDLRRICLDEEEIRRYILCDCVGFKRSRFYHVRQTNREPSESPNIPPERLIDLMKGADGPEHKLRSA